MRILKDLILVGGLLLATACTDKITGPANVNLIQPAGPNCQYRIAPANLATLSDLNSMSGALGSVVTSRENLGTRPEILNDFSGLTAVDSQFSESGGVYSALDFQSLYAASLYYAIELGHKTFSSLDSLGDMTTRIPEMGSRTRIIHEARRTFGEVGVDDEITDNAEYLSHRVGEGTGSAQVLNYLISFPTEDVKDIPLGLNSGIMVHEYSHMVMNHLFWVPGIDQNKGVDSSKPTSNTLRSLDEGLADYFGYLATGDPSFFLCSFPNSNRDLSKAKEFTSTAVSSIAGDTFFSPHEGGAIFAAINYEIATAIGNPTAVGKSLIQLMATLLTCSDTNSGGDLSLNFRDVAACHVKVMDAQHQARAREIYNARLGSYGGI